MKGVVRTRTKAQQELDKCAKRYFSKERGEYVLFLNDEGGEFAKLQYYPAEAEPGMYELTLKANLVNHILATRDSNGWIREKDIYNAVDYLLELMEE